MSRIECFMVECTNKVRQSLRRYEKTSPGSCSGKMSYHNGHGPREVVDAMWTEQNTLPAIPPPPRDDPRWPNKCDDCNYAFPDTDEWQVFQELLYVRPGTIETFTLRDAPVGAIWVCDWFPKDSPASDGQYVCVMTPGGDWMPDMPSSSGTPWQRTGTLPKVTCSSSILIPGRYHGFLNNGYLESCTDSPT